MARPPLPPPCVRVCLALTQSIERPSHKWNESNKQKRLSFLICLISFSSAARRIRSERETHTQLMLIMRRQKLSFRRFGTVKSGSDAMNHFLVPRARDMDVRLLNYFQRVSQRGDRYKFNYIWRWNRDCDAIVRVFVYWRKTEPQTAINKNKPKKLSRFFFSSTKKKRKKEEKSREFFFVLCHEIESVI